MDAEPMPNNIKVHESMLVLLLCACQTGARYTFQCVGSINKHAVLLQAVPLSIDKHRQLMVSVLADQRITELQQRGGAWLAGLTNSASGLAQKSPDCRYQNPNFYTVIQFCAFVFSLFFSKIRDKRDFIVIHPSVYVYIEE